MTVAQNRKAAAGRAAIAAAAANISTLTNRYDAAGTGRRMAGWNPPASGPNRAIVGLQNIRNRASDTIRNDWAGSASIQHWTTNLIGTGIIPRPKRIKAKKKKQAIVELWDAWVKVCDADGILDFYGMETLATRAWFERGEVFIRLRPRRADSPMDVPLQIQLLEADYVPLLDTDSWQGLPIGNIIRSGIELDNRRQRVAYWVYKEHPGDNQGSASQDNSRYVRVAASQMLHLFEPKRPGQLRGVPDIASVLTHLRGVMDYGDTTLERQKIANLFVASIKRTGLSLPFDTVDPITGQPLVVDHQNKQLIGLSPGALLDLDPGEELQFTNPPEAGTMYHEYMRTSGLETSAGQGLPYEMFSGDIRNVSDRTLRIVMNQFRRFAEQRQWQIVIPKFCQPIRAAWVVAAIMAGEIAAADQKDATLVEWAPQGWPPIHPTQDIQAQQTAVLAGFRSRSSVIASNGDDPEAVDDEIQSDQKREKELGIVLNPQTPTTPGETAPKPAPAAPAAPARNDALAVRIENEHRQAETLKLHAEALFYKNGGPKPPDTSALEKTFISLASLLAQQQQSTQALMTAFTQIAQALADRPITVESPKVDVNVAAPNVKVDNNVSPTPLEVNVAAPNVKVENNVQPADVVVALPDRQTVSDIVRDADGNIKQVTQIETTVDDQTKH